MPELVFFRRSEELLRVAVGRTRLVLGRGDTCDVVIPDPSVSRQHVALHYDGTRCLLEDLSGQGTLVAGQPIKHGDLPDGVGVSTQAHQAALLQEDPLLKIVVTGCTR
jgi:pSer/pThr/pTyr-binding forkhead associated (FHA) protein